MEQYLSVVICLTKVQVGDSQILQKNQNQTSDQVVWSNCASSKAGQGIACDHSILLGGLAVLVPETISDSLSAEKVVVPCFFWWEMDQGEAS